MRPYSVLFCIIISLPSIIHAGNTPETLTVSTYDPFTASLSPEAGSAQLPNLPGIKNITARNSESPYGKRISTDPNGLASSLYSNPFSTNVVSLAGPGVKNTSYELLATVKKGKAQHFAVSQLAFLDSATLVCLISTDFGQALLLVNINGEQLSVSSVLPVPAATALSDRSILFTDRENQRIFLAVNAGTAIRTKSGDLGWKCAKTSKPGIWIIRPRKNEDKLWAFDKTQIVARYFSNNSLDDYCPDGLRIETLQRDQAGNLWLGFSDGLLGVLPQQKNDPKSISPEYEPTVSLHNFNKDISWNNTLRADFAEKIRYQLRNGFDAETSDTSKIFSYIRTNPDAYTGAYLEDARNTVYYNLIQHANAKLDSDQVVQNEESYRQYIHIELDNPLSKKKQKLYDYLGFRVRKSQSLLNSLSAGPESSMLATTSLGIFKLRYDAKKQAIVTDWATPYANSFLKDRGETTAGSGTTPAYNASHNEVLVCDNDFPAQHLLILDAATGKLKNSFALFDRAYGSACKGGIVVSDRTIVVANTFGNAPAGSGHSAYYPASGIMKFSSTSRGNWYVDYDWNAANRETTANTATPEFSESQQLLFLYHQPGDGKAWMLSSIGTQTPKGLLPASYDLMPDLSNLPGANLDNAEGNIVIGPQRTAYIGTSSGLLRIKGD